MQQHVFSTQPTYKVCVLIKPSSFKIEQLKQYYIDPAIRAGVNVNDFYGMTLEYLDKKPKAKDMDAYIQKLATIFVNLETQYIYCADSEYFKKLTGQKNSEACIGYAYPCKHSELQHIKVIYGINHSVLFYSPAQEENLNRTVQTLIDCLNLNLKPIGQDIFHKEIYPQDEVNIAACLGALHQHPALTVDIEAFSLDFFKAGVGTITFCWNQHEGIAFNADYAPVMTHDVSGTAIYGLNKPNENVRYFLRQFFDHYKGRLIAHNANYDFKVLIYTLYMEHLRDYEGMLKGIDTLCRLFDDTKIIAYLALNSTEEIKLGLKPLSQEFSGNYSLDAINDITRIPNEKLLRYNLTDGLSTWYVYNKYYPKMVQDEQEELYLTLMKDSIKLILQMELVGMPMSVPRIADAEYQLKVIKNDQLKIMAHNPHVLKALHLHKESTLENINSKLKKIKKDISHLDNLFFNPNSSKQLQTLLYDVMQLPVIDKTDTGLPATGGDTLEKLINHTNDQSKIDVINAIYEYGKAEKILSTFIKAFKQGRVKDDKDFIWLHGSFVLGGTLSGRLSSNSPNMQNMPSGSKYGKLIKSCFVAPQSWIMCYADFNALEDRINTLLTKDPNKLKIFIEGYDAHSLRAYNYFPEAYVGVPNTLEGINDAVKTHKEWRNKGKAPTFAIQYGGTEYTLQQNCGFSPELAAKVYQNYHAMYAVSDKFMDEQIAIAARQGYATLAFGLRLRTPILARTVLGTRNTPYAAKAEARTVGNAVGGQSWGLLNNRALAAFMKTVWESEYRYDILPISMIHDASYLLIKDNLDVLNFVNDHLPKEMAWQEAPEIQHPEVGLGGALDICYQGWHQVLEIPNNASKAEIQEICLSAKEKFS